ncbi:Transposase [Halomicrobium sp. LC1Hm]|nr:Transposase [Halomicrobium sp. LC1Hm]
MSIDPLKPAGDDHIRFDDVASGYETTAMPKPVAHGAAIQNVLADLSPSDHDAAPNERETLYATAVDYWREHIANREVEPYIAERGVEDRFDWVPDDGHEYGLDAPSITLSGPVEIDEVYVSAALKGRERDQESRSRGLSTRRRGSYDGDKPPVFTLVDRGSDDRYVVPAKSADESTIRLLLADHDKESLTVYTDGFRACDPLEEGDAFTREYVVHGDGEYADSDIHATPARATCR